ncbi:MAG: tRNA pseudouridine(38-40) synthase TruA [Propionibacteriaceae bacterium]|jgi:tRNA pseudouridine38-40 synthase|nr:tRNA pseudouridine(38-40) synthase TruA [Propionibacteriaceae bacterium]
MSRLRLDIAYDGTDFHGWAAQEGLRTVQGELQLWLARLLRLDSAALTVAGRTDAGVHARGQVAHLDLPDGMDARETAAALARKLRAVLPEDVVVRQVGVAPAGFDARFSAIWRLYTYRLCDRVPDPLNRRNVTPFDGDLDVEAINAAGQVLVGLHDFTAFCKAREGATAIRTLQQVEAWRYGDNVEITFQADAFCHSMVRSLTGALLLVATGKRDLAWLAGLLDADARAGEITVMPARGLTLEEVGYPPDELLAGRAQEARNTRTLTPEAK